MVSIVGWITRSSLPVAAPLNLPRAVTQSTLQQTIACLTSLSQPPPCALSSTAIPRRRSSLIDADSRLSSSRDCSSSLASASSVATPHATSRSTVVTRASSRLTPFPAPPFLAPRCSSSSFSSFTDFVAAHVVAVGLHTSVSASSPLSHAFRRNALFSNSRDEAASVCLVPTRLKSRDKGKSGKKGKGGGGRIRFDDAFSDVVDQLQFQHEIDEVLQRLTDDVTSQCTVRSGVGVFDQLEVNTVDGAFGLSELGTVSQKSSSLVEINMSSLPNYIPDVLAAVQKSNLNVNPQQEGTKILLPIPKTTKEHRVRLAGEAKKRLESMKGETRQILSQHTREAKKAGKDINVSDDVVSLVEKWLKQEVDDAIGRAEALVQEKQEEVLDAGRG